MNNPIESSDDSYVFQVEVKVKAATRGAALIRLNNLLNNREIEYYQIGSESPVRLAAKEPVQAGSRKSAAKDSPQPDPLETRIRQYIDNNKLIRLNINKGRGVKLNMPCRVVNFDSGNQLITVYHVDEKQVYSIKLNEIDEFTD